MSFDIRRAFAFETNLVTFINVIVKTSTRFKAMFSLSRFSCPVHPGLTNRGKPGRTVANRGRTVAAPWTTVTNRGKPACLAGRFKMFNRTGATRGKPGQVSKTVINRGDTVSNRISIGANRGDTVINRGKPWFILPRFAPMLGRYRPGLCRWKYGLTRCRYGSPRLVAALLRFGPVESFNTVYAGSPRYLYDLDEITCN